METTRQQPGAVARPSDGVGAHERSGPPPVVRILLLVLGIVVLLAAIVIGVKYFAYASTHETTDDATIDSDQVQITSKIAERVNKILVDTNQEVKKGQLLIVLDNTDESAKLLQAKASRDALYAQAQAAEANVALTRDTQNAQNAENEGAIQQAQAGISSAAAQAQSQTQQINAAQAAVDASRAQVKVAQNAVPAQYQNFLKAQADLNRTQSLVSTGDIARSQLDAVQAEYKSAQAQYAQAQNNVAAAIANLDAAEQKLTSQRFATASEQSQIGVQQGQLVTAQGRRAESGAPSRVQAQQATAQAALAQVATADAQYKVAQDQYSYTKIYAPIDGFVGEKDVEVGKTVAPGESLMTIVPVSPIYVTANFKETQVGHMRAGQEVDINVDAYKGVKFVGHVENLSPASQNKFSLVPAQNATGNFVKVTQRLPVRILFDNPDPNYPLRPGMSVETSVKVKN
jgi:membrane fusion protein (multidrug efflux system)